MTTLISSDADIDRIGLGVIDRTLPKAEWTHAGHFAAALWMWRRRPDSALSDMPDLIRAYNLATGVPNTDTGGYHDTITLASMRAARAELSRRPASAPLHEVLDALLASELGRSDWPLAYWSRERLFSVEARRTWIEPDLRPLPF